MTRRLCAEQRSPRDTVCLALERERRIGPPPPLPQLWVAASLPAALLGCFEVRASGGASAAGSCRRKLIDPFVQPELFTCAPPGADADEICIAADRFFARERRGSWDGWRSGWAATDAGRRFRNDASGTPLAELRRPEGGAPVAELHGEVVELNRFAPEREREVLADIARLPSIEAAFAAASRCPILCPDCAAEPANSLASCGKRAREPGCRSGIEAPRRSRFEP
jgi:hypothetical protein